MSSCKKNAYISLLFAFLCFLTNCGLGATLVSNPWQYAVPAADILRRQPITLDHNAQGFLLVSQRLALHIAQDQSHGTLEEVSHLKGAAYREAIAPFLHEFGTDRLELLLQDRHEKDFETWQIRILLAHIREPEVFAELEQELNTWRQERHDRPSHGQLSHRLFLFSRRGPESPYVEELAGWEPWPVTSAQGKTAVFTRQRRKRVLRFSEAEVAAGIERNLAAQLAILEHFLKFMDDDTPYEQSEMVLLVARLWGRGWNIGRPKTAGPAPDVDYLLNLVFSDPSRPFEARFNAADNLAATHPREVCAFMLETVTNMPANTVCRSQMELMKQALFHLYWLADANDCAALMSQTNGPAWRKEQIRVTVGEIEERLKEAK